MTSNTQKNKLRQGHKGGTDSVKEEEPPTEKGPKHLNEEEKIHEEAKSRIRLPMILHKAELLEQQQP